MWMVFDTGNMSGLAVGSETADRLHLPVEREVISRDSGGDVLGTIPVYEVRYVRVFGVEFTDQDAVLHGDDDFHGARVGEGLLGPRYFLGRSLTLDYEARLVAVTDSPRPPQPEDVVLEMVTVPGLEGMPVVRGAVNGRSILMQLDTGKSRTVVDPELARSLELPDAPRGPQVQSLRVGSREFMIPSAKLSSLRGISRGLPEPILVGVGSDVLSRMIWTIDYQGGIVILHSR